MVKSDVLESIREIYSDLRKQHPHKLEDEDYGITIDKPDYWFLACLCWIARRNKIQQNLWEKVRKNFGEKYNGDIRNIKTKNDSENIGYPKNFVPYKWLPNLSKYLNKEGIDFKTFIKNIENKTGIEIRDEFIKILGIQGKRAKRISVFIRDCPLLQKNVFPIDSNVDKMLRNMGLPCDEEIMVRLCEETNIDPKLFERVLYEHGRVVCGHGKTCSIDKFCLSNEFKLNRC